MPESRKDALAKPGRVARTQNISLQPIEWLALRKIATEEERGNISGLVARLLDSAMRERIGRDWRVVIAEETQEASAA